LLVGEAPGYRSWKNRRRFTGPAGLLIRRALARVGDPRYEDLESLFYMTDAVKCHPAASHNKQANRSPRRAEAEACLGHLVRELQVLQPSAIVTFGKAAAEAVRQALLLAGAGAGRRPKPALLAFPHPSPRNQVTIRKHYPSIMALERDIARTFRRLIGRLKTRGDHA
jgi:uracil-DNA glycosylase family 4